MLLGRYRRAAYIYAELLGEYHNAAKSLETGGWYREAAVVYREKLGLRQDEAKCLERGGLFDDAIKVIWICPTLKPLAT